VRRAKLECASGRGQRAVRALDGPCRVFRTENPWRAPPSQSRVQAPGKDVTSEFYDERIATNLRHMFFAIQAVAPGMIAAGGGSIINLGSDSWWRAGGGFPVYTTANAAVHGLTRDMARDLGPQRIGVNTLVREWTMTDYNSGSESRLQANRPTVQRAARRVRHSRRRCEYIDAMPASPALARMARTREGKCRMSVHAAHQRVAPERPSAAIEMTEL
jgi:NAD(P)-dependent dehydrogenase (short-subunit alcohol dehydrogenase family)